MHTCHLHTGKTADPKEAPTLLCRGPRNITEENQSGFSVLYMGSIMHSVDARLKSSRYLRSLPFYGFSDAVDESLRDLVFAGGLRLQPNLNSFKRVANNSDTNAGTEALQT